MIINDEHRLENHEPEPEPDLLIINNNVAKVPNIAQMPVLVVQLELCDHTLKDKI